MGKSVQNFIQNFQDMFITKVTTLQSFPNNLSNIELMLIDQQLTDISERLSNLVSITKDCTEENLEEYKNIIKILSDKLEYVEDLSDMLLYINSFYDMNNVLDIHNYDLRDSLSNSNITYDNEFKSLSLVGVSNNYNCPKEIIDGISFTYYNTNSSYHGGILLHSPYLDILSIKTITLIKTDGTIIKLPFSNFNKNSYNIKHDYLSSTQINIEFNVNILALPTEEQEYYKSLKVTLIDYDYINEGVIALEPKEYVSSRLFNFISKSDIPNDTFINLNLTLDLKDINDNKITTTNLLLPLGIQKICKRLNNIDFSTVQEILGIYIKNKYKENIKNKITIDYLKTLENKNEIYIVYTKKIKEEDLINNYYKILNNQGVVFLNKNIKKIKVYTTLEFFTFNSNISPMLNLLVGVTKR